MSFPNIFKKTQPVQLSAPNLSKKQKKLMVELSLRTTYLTKKDIADWRRAWQMAINVENPKRYLLYNIYDDVMIDLHLTGCINQRMEMVLRKSFRLVDNKGTENKELTELLECEWFKSFMKYVLESRFYGHSLIQFDEVISVNNLLRFSEVSLVPRKHVVPEYGVILRDINDDISRGISYKDTQLADWCIEAGGTKDLGLLLKCAPSAISKKHMLSYWDAFGEMFGAPIRIAKTASRDPKDIEKIEKMMDGMGAMPWGVFPEGTEVEFKETSKGDAYNVYDKRIERCNSEITKGVLNQTMTIDNGASLSQSQVHLQIFENVVESDADFLRDVINDKLIPYMIKRGFPLEGYRFNWDDAVDYTTQDMQNVEGMLLNAGYEIDPQYFVDKYNIKITGKKEKGFFE